MKFNVCEKSDGVMKGTRNAQCPICGAAEFGTLYFKIYQKSSYKLEMCERNRGSTY
jgi:hypothetical protein